ncbi:glycosyltransferase [Dactylosporangium sp. CA-152071]|uniref:glycosyltransferase n=1 Tax=Dactylosporangium sp. CA-152071 TaxID=3239933 RepID=UPI003D8E87ED
MRVLVTVNDAYGHVLPLVPTVQELISRRHDMLVACPGGTLNRLSLGGLRTCRYVPVETAPLPIGPPPRDRIVERLAFSVHLAWPNVARGWAGQLLEDARRFRPDLVICEPVEHAGRVVAAILGVPFVEHGWGFTLPVGADVTAAHGLADLYQTTGTTYQEPSLRVDLGSAALQASDIDQAIERYRYVAWSPPTELLAPPGLKPRVLVTLGTFPKPGAAERLQQAVGAATELDAEPVVVLGNEDRRSLDGWPSSVTVREWVDLPAEITRCALVVHHGGAGTSWATLLAGVPAVCLPQSGDQFRNAERLAGAGAATVVMPDAMDALTLRRAFSQALADPSLAAGADRVRRSNDSLPPTAALVDRLEMIRR